MIIGKNWGQAPFFPKLIKGMRDQPRITTEREKSHGRRDSNEFHEREENIYRYLDSEINSE